MDAVIDFIVQVLVHIKHLPWDAILVSLGGSAVVATITQFLKKRLDNKTKTKVLGIAGFLAAIPDVLGQIVNNPTLQQYLPANFAWVFTGAVALHALLTTPPFKRLQTTLRQYKQALDDVRAEDNAQVAPMDNPNLTLNNDAPVSQSAPVEPEKPVLRIQ